MLCFNEKQRQATPAPPARPVRLRFAPICRAASRHLSTASRAHQHRARERSQGGHWRRLCAAPSPHHRQRHARRRRVRRAVCRPARPAASRPPPLTAKCSTPSPLSAVAPILAPSSTSTAIKKESACPSASASSGVRPRRGVRASVSAPDSNRAPRHRKVFSKSQNSRAVKSVCRGVGRGRQQRQRRRPTQVTAHNCLTAIERLHAAAAAVRSR